MLRMNWKEQKVPIAYVQQCHLLDYEHQLLSIVLSHCRYSLKHGQGQDISYDLCALEKHIVDRFIHGKPFLQLDIPQVVYRRDVYMATSFANIRKKVSPQVLPASGYWCSVTPLSLFLLLSIQVKLSFREQQDIIRQLQTMQKIRHCLDVVEIAMGFLATGGQKAENDLGSYVEKTLRMKHKLSSKKVVLCVMELLIAQCPPLILQALKCCRLGHVLSLWETLSVELARRLTLSGQVLYRGISYYYTIILLYLFC